MPIRLTHGELLESKGPSRHGKVHEESCSSQDMLHSVIATEYHEEEGDRGEEPEPRPMLPGALKCAYVV